MAVLSRSDLLLSLFLVIDLLPLSLILFFFFLNDTATPEIYPLPLHDPLPICPGDAAEKIDGRSHVALVKLLEELPGASGLEELRKRPPRLPFYATAELDEESAQALARRLDEKIGRAHV